MNLSITNPPSDSTLSTTFTASGSCDAIPAKPGRVVPVTDGPTITVKYQIGGVDNATVNATCYSNQTWSAPFTSVGVTTGDNGSLVASCSEAGCPNSSVTDLTVC